MATVKVRSYRDSICRSNNNMEVQGISWPHCKESYLLPSYNIALHCMMHVVHLLSSLKELELLETPLAAQAQHKAKHQTQEAHRAAISWWRGQTKEGKKNQAPQVPQETVTDIQSLDVNHIRPAQLEEAKCGMKVLLKDQGTSSCDDAQIQFRDVAVVTDSSAERLAAEELLKSLRKVEDVVSQALRAAQVLMGSEKRIKERIEAISMRVERALSRAEATESQLRALEATISSNTQVRTGFRKIALIIKFSYAAII